MVPISAYDVNSVYQLQRNQKNKSCVGSVRSKQSRKEHSLHRSPCERQVSSTSASSSCPEECQTVHSSRLHLERGIAISVGKIDNLASLLSHICTANSICSQSLCFQESRIDVEFIQQRSDMLASDRFLDPPCTMLSGRVPLGYSAFLLQRIDQLLNGTCSGFELSDHRNKHKSDIR
jgi:hypothetical protein